MLSLVASAGVLALASLLISTVIKITATNMVKQSHSKYKQKFMHESHSVGHQLIAFGHCVSLTSFFFIDAVCARFLILSKNKNNEAFNHKGFGNCS
jgi:galactitol-specific phosphotransferase system IIC component